MAKDRIEVVQSSIRLPASANGCTRRVVTVWLNGKLHLHAALDRTEQLISIPLGSTTIANVELKDIGICDEVLSTIAVEISCSVVASVEGKIPIPELFPLPPVVR